MPKTESKVIAKRGWKLVEAITYAKKCTTITVKICFSASGQYMLPMIVFAREKIDLQLMLNAEPRGWKVCSGSS